jgi:copper ion binding protein
MKKTISVEGMTCGHCVAHVKKALEEIPGVRANVVLEEGKAYVTASEDVMDETLKKAVEDAGYTARDVRQG